MRFTTPICSYIFFALIIFNALALLSSEFLSIFSQVFTLFSQNGSIYNVFSLLFALFAMLITFVNTIKIYRRKKYFGKTAPFMVLLFALIMLVLLSMTMYWLWGKFNIDINTPLLLDGEMQQTQSVKSYYTSLECIIPVVCWICLVVLPLLYKVLSLRFNIQNRLGKFLFLLEPSTTTIVIIMSANAFYPYFSDLPSRYMYVIFYLVSYGLFLYLLFCNNREFGFYDYINVLLLAIMLCYVILCSESVLRGHFFNAQLTFYMLGVLSWCGEWVQNRDTLHDQIT